MASEARKLLRFGYAPVQGSLITIAGMCALGAYFGAPISGVVTLPILAIANAVLALLPIAYHLWHRNNIDPTLFDKSVNPNALPLYWHYLNGFGYAFDLPAIKHHPGVWKFCVAALNAATVALVFAGGIAVLDIAVSVIVPLTLAFLSFSFIGFIIPLAVYAVSMFNAKVYPPEPIDQDHEKSVFILHQEGVEMDPAMEVMFDRLDEYTGQSLSFCNPPKTLQAWKADLDRIQNAEAVPEFLQKNNYVIIYQKSINSENPIKDELLERMLKAGVRILRVIDDVPPKKAAASTGLKDVLKIVYTKDPQFAGDRWTSRQDKLLAYLTRWTNKAKSPQYYAVVYAEDQVRGPYHIKALLETQEDATTYKKTLPQDQAMFSFISKVTALKDHMADPSPKQRFFNGGDSWSQQTTWDAFEAVSQQETALPHPIYKPLNDVCYTTWPGVRNSC